jgi:MFS family permease
MDDTVVGPEGSHEPTEYAKTPGKAAASGWVGSALEYYDFFIFAQAAALVFPDIMFPEDNPAVATVASLATFGVAYVARPIGAVVLGHWGDTHGRKNVLVLAMMLMGLSTFLIALLPTYHSVGIAAPIMLVILRIVQGFAVAGELSGASAMIVEHSPFGRRGYFASFTLQGTQAGQILAAAVFIPLSIVLSESAFESWGWRIPFLLSAVVVLVGLIIRRRVDETPAFQEEATHGEVPKAPIVVAFRDSGSNMFRVVLMALMNVVPVTTATFGAVFATDDDYGNGMSKTTYLWISVLANVVAVGVIPLVGNLTDRIGRRPCIIAGALGAGILSIPYLYFVDQGNVPLTMISAVFMWGCVYQGYNAVFPSFYQELFPTKTRVTAFAVAQNIGTAITAFLPSIFAVIAPPGGSTNVPLVIGGITFGISCVVALSAYSAQETFRIHMNDLGAADAVPVPEEEYERLRLAAHAA